MSTLVPSATNAFSSLPSACYYAIEKLLCSLLLFRRAFLVPSCHLVFIVQSAELVYFGLKVKRSGSEADGRVHGARYGELPEPGGVSGSSTPGASTVFGGRSPTADLYAHRPLATAFYPVKLLGPHSHANVFDSDTEWRGSVHSPTFSQSNCRQPQERNPSRSEEPQITIFCWCIRSSPFVVLSHAPHLSSLRRCFLVETSTRTMGHTV